MTPRAVLGAWLLIVVAGAAVAWGVTRPDPWANFPEPGHYIYPSVQAPIPDTQTLRYTIEGARLGEVRVEGASAGPPGGSATTTLLIAADTNSYLFVDELVLDGGSCPRLIVSDLYAWTAVIQDNHADGNSIEFIASTTTAQDVVVESTRDQVDRFISLDTPYDRIWLDAGAGATVQRLVIQDYAGRGGDCELRGLKVGSIEIRDWRVGAGDGLAIADLELAINVGNSATSTNNAEEFITIR
jgi:hypothetical protein